MGTIFTLSGSKAVGKTTLINGLGDKMKNLIIREGFRQTKLGYNLNIREEYFENEKWYFAREIREYKKFKKSDSPVLLLRGAEDLEFYALHYPRIKGRQWRVEQHMVHELEELRKCKSDYILYLDADQNTIRQRKENDLTKPRVNMKDWQENWQPFIERHMKQLSCTTVLNTDTMTAEDVLEWTIQWMEEKIHIN